MRHPLFTDKHVLEPYIQLPNLAFDASQVVDNKTAFITGATGFIGGFLLKELLEQNTFESCICLVRANSQDSGFQRVKNNLLEKGCNEHFIDPSVIKVVTGDILAPSFGLIPDVLNQLSKNVDHVFHFAATMNWITPFNRDTRLNIEALKSIIGFCSNNKLKKLHYASSMGIWTVQNHQQGSILENESHSQEDELPGGYFQSKWVSEQILNLAKSQGLPVNIYRIGDVKGNSQNGLGDPNNFGNLVMRYFIENKIVIDSDVPEFNFIPVDYLTKAIAHISLHETGKTYQFSNPELVSFKDIFNAAIDTGQDCELISKTEWISRLKNDKSQFGTLLKPIFRPFTPDTKKQITSFYSIGANMFQRRHSTTNTDNMLSLTNICCPSMLSDFILNKYMIHLGQSKHNSCVQL